MKKFLLFAWVAGVLFVTCTKRGLPGPKGDTGPKGDRGSDVRDVSLFNFDIPNIIVKQAASAKIQNGNLDDYLANSFNNGRSVLLNPTVNSDSTAVFFSRIIPSSTPDGGLAVLIPFKEPLSDLASLSLAVSGQLGEASENGSEEEDSKKERIFGLIATLTRIPIVIQSSDIGYLYPFTPYGKFGDESTRGQSGFVDPDKPIGYTPLVGENIKSLLLVLGKAVKNSGETSGTGRTVRSFAAGNSITLTITAQLGNRTTTKHISLSAH